MLNSVKTGLLLSLAVLNESQPLSAQPGTWQKVAIDDSITVEFPGQPKQIKHKGQIAYGVYQTGILYSVSIQHKAADAGSTVEEKREFYEEVMQGAAERAGATEVEHKTRFIVNGFEGLQATFNSSVPQLSNPVTTRVVLVNGTLYSQMFSAPLGSPLGSTRQRFFTSFAPLARPAPTTPAETHTDAYRLGQLIGQLAVYGAIIAGVFLLLVRAFSNRRSP